MSQLQTQPPASATPTAPATLSVIVPSYNNLPALLKCLKSLVQTLSETASQGEKVQAEILCQDDCSTSFAAHELIGPPVQIARNERNLGFAGNCNAGAARARGDVLLFLNQDTVARAGWYAPLMGMFADPKVGIVGPKLVFARPKPAEGQPDPGDSIQSCGGLYGGNRGPFHRYLGYAADDWRVNVRERVSWTTGAALAVRADAFRAVGGFDIGYGRGYFEDVALCEAVKAQGYEVWYCPDAVFEHVVGTSGGVAPEQFRANSLRFHEQWDKHITPDTPVVHVNY